MLTKTPIQPNITCEQLASYANRVTPAQLAALLRVRKRWSHMTAPVLYVGGEGCVVVQVGSTEQPNQMTLGIEPDGYTHS